MASNRAAKKQRLTAPIQPASEFNEGELLTSPPTFATSGDRDTKRELKCDNRKAQRSSGESVGSNLCRTSPVTNPCLAQNWQSPAAPLLPPEDSWTIYQPGDSPQMVKARLRDWAQAVARSLGQYC